MAGEAPDQGRPSAYGEQSEGEAACEQAR
jgi:hypothetical protein